MIVLDVSSGRLHLSEFEAERLASVLEQSPNEDGFVDVPGLMLLSASQAHDVLAKIHKALERGEQEDQDWSEGF